VLYKHEGPSQLWLLDLYTTSRNTADRDVTKTSIQKCTNLNVTHIHDTHSQ